MRKPLEVPQKARVLIKIWEKRENIPKDAQERFVAQLHGHGTGGGSVKSGTIRFGEKRDASEMAARFQLARLIEQGFVINNIYAVADPKKEGWFFVHVWLNFDDSGNGKSIADWLEAGKFVENLLKVPRSYVSVFDNGDLISVNMNGYPVRNPQKRFDQIVPEVVAPAKPIEVAAVVPEKAVVLVPVIIPEIVPVADGSLSAMQVAFRSARVRS